MATVELNQKQLNHIARALVVYSEKLQEYDDDPGQSMETASYVLVLAEKFRMLAAGPQ